MKRICLFLLICAALSCKKTIRPTFPIRRAIVHYCLLALVLHSPGRCPDHISQRYGKIHLRQYCQYIIRFGTGLRFQYHGGGQQPCEGMVLPDIPLGKVNVTVQLKTKTIRSPI